MSYLLAVAKARLGNGPRWLLLAGLALLLVSCASTGATRRAQHAPLDDLPKPPILLVYDFAVNANDVVVDTLGPGFLSNGGDPSERLEVAREVQDDFAKTLVSLLREKGLKARRARSDATPVRDALLLKGQFLSVDEGDAMGRTIIGFGRGSTELRIGVQVYQMSETGPRQLVSGEGEATGSKRPGMFVPVAGGAALGTAATSAVVSGTVQVVGEATGRMAGDVRRLAEDLAERAVQFYIDRGWLDEG